MLDDRHTPEEAPQRVLSWAFELPSGAAEVRKDKAVT